MTAGEYEPMRDTVPGRTETRTERGTYGEPAQADQDQTPHGGHDTELTEGVHSGEVIAVRGAQAVIGVYARGARLKRVVSIDRFFADGEASPGQQLSVELRGGSVVRISA